MIELVRLDSAASIRENFHLIKDEFSPFCDDQNMTLSGDDLYVDPAYGQVYSGLPSEGAAVYGKTEDLPPFSGDFFGNDGYLRVPFRRIPRIRMKSNAQFRQFIANIEERDPNLRLLYRGQANEYLLKRSSADTLRLYGQSEALEPSLPASSTRASENVENVLSEWCALIQLFMSEHKTQVQSWASTETIAALDRDFRNLRSQGSFQLFSLALAQHYGLPSVGIDVTTAVDTALFFALHNLKKEEGCSTLKPSRVTKSDNPVIYVFSVSKNQYMDFDDFRPANFPATRPDKQTAFFLHTGWGMKSNDVARRIWVAIYLDPGGDWPVFSDHRSLFPSPDDDPFGRFLEKMRTQLGGVRVAKFLDYLYWVEA